MGNVFEVTPPEVGVEKPQKNSVTKRKIKLDLVLARRGSTFGESWNGLTLNFGTNQREL